MPRRCTGNQIGRRHREAFKGLKRSSIQVPKSMATETSPATGSAFSVSRLLNDQPCPSQPKSAADTMANETPSHANSGAPQTIPATTQNDTGGSRWSSHAPITVRPETASASTAARHAPKHRNGT